MSSRVADDRELVGHPGVDTAATEAAWASLQERVTISLRPIASPSAIGLFGLAAGAFTLSGLQLGWMPVGQGRQVAVVLIGFAFAAQLIASIFAYLARDVVVSTAMGVLALSWLVIGLVLFTSPVGSTSKALGLLLVCSGTIMVLTSVTAALSKLVPALVFLLAGIRFVATGIYQLSAESAWKSASGVVGLFLAVLALYTAWAFQLEGALKKPVLPLGRRGQGSTAVHGSLFEQVKDISVEPGVRSQL
jgi:uncharacterized protein